MQNFNALGNIQFGKDYVLFSINPEIYALKTVKKAALAFQKKACIILDGNPAQEIIVEIRPKISRPLQELAEEFNNLLLEDIS